MKHENIAGIFSIIVMLILTLIWWFPHGALAMLGSILVPVLTVVMVLAILTTPPMPKPLDEDDAPFYEYE